MLRHMQGNYQKIKFILKNLLNSQINSYSIFQLIKITIDFKSILASGIQSLNNDKQSNSNK
jgi:hypothetical protein